MNSSPTPKRQSRTRREQGIALVTVLAILTLTAVLVMAFFTISRSELASSTVYSRGIEASHLSKAAVDMVIHQIRSATERNGFAWATQPGMVRTWATSNDGVQECYKLYSDDSMVITESKQDSNVFDDMADMASWKNDVRFVDLNAPIARVYDSTEEYFYPIIDPKAAIGRTQVEGFSVNFGAVGASTASRTLPMPVKWIYQLEDGTLGTLTGGGTTGVFQPLTVRGQPLAGNAQPTADNPIVARFAFWADDETAKLNVNTAAGGVAWDTPRAGGVSDRAYGMFQPVANEFQRYPGHPATTSMIHVIFPGVALPNSERYDRRSAEIYYDLIPRVQRGGSVGGGYAGTDNRYGLISAIQPDEDRLYATIDEFIFRAPRVGSSDGKTSSQFKRAEQVKVGEWPPLEPKDLGRLQFFLTATSKAPEVTIFNTPRISVWPSFYGDPTSPSEPHFTSYDRRLRFCAEVGKRDLQAPSDPRAPKDNGSPQRSPAMYHFQRMNNASCTADYANIVRNRELYAYLQEMMSTTIPGMDVSDGVTNYGSFESKYGSRNRDQIITEIFDYIRSVNLFDDLLMKQHEVQKLTPQRLPSAPVDKSKNFAINGYYGYWPPAAENVGTHTSFTPGRLSVYNKPDLLNGHPDYIGADTHTGHGQVAPIRITPPGGQETKGFGRFFGVKEAGIAILACAQDNGLPGGVARKGVGVTNINTFNEGWSTSGVRVTGATGADPKRVLSDGKPPSWDYSNIPPLSIPPRDPEQPVTDAQLNKIVEVYSVPFPHITKALLQSDDPIRPNATGVPTDSDAMTGRQFADYVTLSENWNRTLETDKPLTGGATQVQAILLVSLFCPSKGWTLVNADFRLEMDVVRDFGLNGTDLGFPMSTSRAEKTIKTPHASFRRVWGGRDNGGIFEPRLLTIAHRKMPGTPRVDELAYGLMARSAPDSAVLNRANSGDYNMDLQSPPESEASEGRESFIYPWVSPTMTIPGNGVVGVGAEPAPTMSLKGGKLIIRIFPDGGARTDGTDPSTGRVAVENSGTGDYSQRVSIDFKDTTIPLPILAGPAYGHVREDLPKGTATPASEGRAKESWTWNRYGAFRSEAPPVNGVNNGTNRGRLAAFNGNQGYAVREAAPYYAYAGHSLCRSVDVIRSYVIPHGDDRLICAMREVPEGIFQPHPSYDPPAGSGSSPRLVASNFTVEFGNQGYGREGVPGLTNNGLIEPKRFVPDANTPYGRRPVLPDSFERNMDRWGDWDNGVAAELDGPFINKPDEGNAMGVAYKDFIPKPWVTISAARAFVPYFTDSWIQEPAGPGLWSPNRMMPGPGMFGSLPTGVYPRSGGGAPQPWQTLLFRRIGGTQAQSAQGQSPRVSGPGRVHPGWEHPRDHYLLDFFWMPVVEPYSISEPLATAGKVNMNYAIQPFDYIKRKSSLLGVFSSEELLTVPNKLLSENQNSYKDNEGWGANYNKTTNSGGSLRDISLRSWIGLEETLRQFDAVFGRPGGSTIPQIFRTSSQICEQWLVPGKPVKGNPYGVTNGLTLETVSQYYNPDNNALAAQRSFGLVGDNSRERPYTNLVARLTTKSNTFNVHYRAQVLRQSPLSPNTPGARRTDAQYATFDSSVDKMVGEYRGSSIVERYIDPNDLRIPDYAARAESGNLGLGTPNPQVETLDKFYRFRIVSEKRFAP